MQRLLAFLSFILCIYLSQESGLCAKTSKQDVDCSSLISFPDVSQTCSVKYFPTNSTECSKIEFEKGDHRTTNLGNVVIKPFIWTYSSLSTYTVFNVSFSNITWKSALFRFTNNEVPSKNHCRKISLSEHVNSSRIENITLNYDCYWSLQMNNYEHKNFIFEYNLRNSTDIQYGKFHFVVPSVNEIASLYETCQPFTYYDLENLDCIYLHIINVNESCNIKKYFITVITKTGNLSTTIETDNSSDETVFKYTRKTVGKLNFIVSINESDKYDFKSFIGISDLNIAPNEFISYVCLLWIVFSLLIFFLLGFGIFMWCRYNRFTSNDFQIFVFHSPGTKEDNEIFDIFLNYLKDLKFNILNEKDIKYTTHRDPALWSMIACNNSNIIVYILNPSQKKNTQNNEIYVDLDKKILDIIKNDTYTKGKIAIMNFGVYDKNEIPQELICVKMYNVFKDWKHIYSLFKGYNSLDSKIFPIPDLKKSIIGKQLYQLVKQCLNPYS